MFSLLCYVICMWSSDIISNDLIFEKRKGKQDIKTYIFTKEQKVCMMCTHAFKNMFWKQKVFSIFHQNKKFNSRAASSASFFYFLHGNCRDFRQAASTSCSFSVLTIPFLTFTHIYFRKMQNLIDLCDFPRCFYKFVVVQFCVEVSGEWVCIYI